MNKAIIFDLDGTLWNTIDATYETANLVAQKYHCKAISKETIFHNYGNNKYESAKTYFPDIDQNEAIKILEECDKLNNINLTKIGGYIYPNLNQILFELSTIYDLFIVSNTDTKKYIETFLVTSKTEKYFKDYVAASEIALSKGEAINKIIQDYDIENAIYVGDTLKDYEAAKIANIPFIQCLYGFGDDLNLQYSIKDITELPNKVNEIFNK